MRIAKRNNNDKVTTSRNQMYNLGGMFIPVETNYHSNMKAFDMKLEHLCVWIAYGATVFF